MVYTDENAVGESDPRVMKLRAEKTELTRKMNSAVKFQEKDAAEKAFSGLSEEEHNALQEAGLQHISQKGDTYYRDIGFDSTQSNGQLDNFRYLNDTEKLDALPEKYRAYADQAKAIRGMLVEALGAEALGKDIGYTVDDILRLYEGDINMIAGLLSAQDISSMDSDFARWNRQVLGVGTQAGLNQFATGMRQAFSDDYIEPNKTAYKAQFTREDLKRYGDEQIANGSNISQMLFDTTQTTANMLPMIAASYLMTKAGLAPVAGEIVGAGLMGLSSGGNTYQQALAEGWDKTDAKAYATILGAAEGTMQYLIGGIGALGGVGEEGLLKAATGINNAAVRFATETGIHILSETTEELAQNRLQRYLDYKLGATDDADWMSWNDDDWYTVIVTALSTGALEAPGVARSTFGAQRLGGQLSGQRIIPSKQEQGGNAVISEIGKAMQSDSALSYTLIAMATDTEMQGTDAYELAERMESGKAPKNAMNLGNLYRDVVNEYVARNGKGGYEDATAAIIGGATKYNALQSAKTELEAADQRASEVRKENPGVEVLNANATELQGYGVNNTKQATEYGAILNKVMSGTDISDAEMDKLLGDSTAAKASRLILEKQNNDPVAVQQLRLSLTRENTEGARDVIKAQIQQFREEKAARKEAEKVSVVQAAMNAANKSEVSRAAANADLQEQVPAATVEAVQKADADVEAAQSRVKQIERMSFKELAAAKDLGLTEEAIDAGVVQDLQKQMAALNERADKLAAVRFPSQQQRTQLADIREQQAAIKEQLVAAKMSSQSRVEQRAAAVQQAAAAPVQAEAARSNPNVLVLPNGTQVSREEFVQQRVANGQSEANANAAFDELVAQTAPTQKGNIENGQTTDQNGQRNDVGIEADRGEDQKQGDQSEPSADGRREAGVRELRTESGNLAAEVTENASVVDSDHIEVLSQKYKDLPELTSSLKRSGFKKITYVTEGDLLNVLGQSVPALYNDGELYLCLDYKTDGYDYVATAEHERTHLRLDLMRARFGESDTRTMVTSALQTILGEDSYVEAFKRYAERYGPVYLSHGLDVETVGHMINEEMLCDMVGGINNFGTQLGDFQSETEDLLEASKFNVVMQNLVDNPSADPGTVETGEIPKGSMPYGIPADTLISTQNVDNPSTQPADASQVSKSAFYGLAEALGFKVDQTGTKNKVYYLNDEDAKLGRNGFTQITVDMIKESPIGDLIRYSVDKGDITPGQAEQEYNLFASIASITDQTHDFYQAMQFMGSTIFTALKANSDTQYGTTYDFPSICTKTQAVINEMSAQMVARGRSLTEAEIRQAYNDVFNDGNPVPCPECYVFSRWVGIGGLLDNIRSYQERFGKMSVDEVIAAYNEANKEVLAFAKENGLSKGRAKGSLASLLDKQYKSLEEDIQKRENQGEAVPNKDYEIRDKLAARMSTIRSLTWIDEVYFAGKEHKAGNVNPNFSVPINVLYDLNEGETFARDYKEAWAFRTTQGAGYGKAITPYAEAILGEGMLVTANTTKSIKAKAAGALSNPYQAERGRITDSSARGKNLKTARKKELNQLFIGGQRLQSTSDARFDNAVDYLLAALELQSMKGGAQVYTKVPGAVAFFDICKMCTNMSMMPKGGGLDASGNPVDTSVGGMDLKTMVMLRKRFEHAGSITIGVNDAHIRALMAQEFRDFIIPYHASGGKIDLIEYFRQVQDPDLKNQKDSEGNPIKIRSSDYTKTQSDKILSDELLRSYFGKTDPEIEDIHECRDTRLWILTAGKSGTYYSDVLDPYAEGLTESQSNARTVLQELYASMQADGKWNGVQLAKGKVEHQIFPNEFWDTKSTYDTSSVNTQRYLDYCDALGFLHRFSGKTISKGQIIPVTGYDQNGNKVELTDLAYDKDGNIEPFFWKTLTDRRMYGNEGQFLEQPNVDLTNLKAETVATFAAPMGERRYNHRVSVTKAAERAANASYEEIKKAEAREKSPVLQPTDTIAQSDGKIKTEIPSINEVPAEKVTEEAPSVPRYSMREEDPDTLKFLNDQLEKGEVVHAYKSFLEVPNEDGTVSLYPPMATKVSAEKKGGKRKMANAMAVGEWEKSVGNPNSRNIFRDKETGKWKYNLIKDNGDTVPADYDPYQHSSNVVLNDQFEQAYARPNLVTYEVIVPQSEMTSGFHYRAANDAGEIVEAALPVGEHPWKKGIVAGKLKNTDRKVYMTRWLMPVRKVENSEVAQMYKDILDREENPVAIPFNVVPPGLQEELEKIGVPIDYEGSGQYKYWQKNNPEKFPSGKPISRNSIQGNVGYHAGDLGKAEYLRQQGRSRGTGHFGTGTYFVGEEEKVTKDSYYGKRPQHAVDFSDYKLYKVRNDRDGYRLHDALKIIDGGIEEEWIAPAVQGEFYLVNPTGYYELAKSKYGEDWTQGDNLLNSQLEFAKENGIDLQSWEEYKAEEGGDISDEDLKYYYEDYVKDTLKEKINAINSEYQEFRDAVFGLNLLTGLKDAKIFSALQKVADYQKSTPRDAKSDSYATVFMKAMGYDGVDVRDTGLDNTTYGSVIYDVKPETVRYSIQDDTENTNDNPYPPNTLQHDLLEAARNGNLSEWVTQQMNAHEDALENAKIRPPVIPSKGFVPKVSEQEKAALEKRRQGLIQAKGAMKPSEKSNGFAMPKADETGNRFRRFLQNAGSAQELKVAQDQVEKFAFTDIASTYVPDSNKADLTWAKDVIHEDGLESAIKQFNREALKMEMPANVTKSLALGQQLLIETSRQGDMQNFLDVLSSLTLLSSQAGKSLQAFRMLKQSGPIGELYYVQKAVKQLNDRSADKITAGKMAEITVPEDLSKAVLMASDEASRDKAMDDLIAGIAAQVPVTMMDKWNAWRYLAMLGNARTHVRNIIGNAVFVPLRFAKDLMAAGGEFIATKAGLMEEGDRRKSVSVSRELRDFAKQDAKIMQKELQGSGKYNPAREILDARKVLPGFLETLSRKNGQALEYEDWLFLSPAYQKALSQALAHTGYTVEEMQNGSNYDAVKALNNARRIAVEEAQKATYRDFNAAASMLNRIKRMESGKASDKVIGVLLEGVLPFTKTPINILRRGVEYSPIGIASSIFEAAAGVKNGNLDVAEFIDHLSAGLSGTAVAVLGYLLASLGYIRGKKDDKEEEFEKLQGYQDYSLQIGDVSATIDWAAPTALPLFTGAAVHSMIRDGKSLEWKDAWDAMMMIAEPMMSLSMLDGLNNVLSSASYADDSQKLATVASSAFTSYLGQAFPTLLGQVARSVDGTRRSTYIDKNSPVPTAIQRFVQSSVQNKIPVWESQKIPYIDVWGREDTNDSKVLGALENFLSPSYINVVNTTDVDETLRELYDKTKENSVLPSQVGKYFSVNGERKDLTPDEYVSYAKDVGSTKYTLLAQLFADPRYMALTDEQKAKAISKIYSYATAVGKYHIDQNYDLHGQGKWMEEANAMPTEIQRFNRIWEYLEEYLSK